MDISAKVSNNNKRKTVFSFPREEVFLRTPKKDYNLVLDRATLFYRDNVEHLIEKYQYSHNEKAKWTFVKESLITIEIENEKGISQIEKKIIASIGRKLDDDYNSPMVQNIPSKSIIRNTKRVIRVRKEVIEVNPDDCFGNLILGKDLMLKCDPLFFSDSLNLYVILTIIGTILTVLSFYGVLPGYCAMASLASFPSLIIVFCFINVPVLKLFYILTFVVSGIIVSREREYNWAIYIAFIVSGLQYIIFGLYADAKIINRNLLMRKMGAGSLLFTTSFLVMLHLGLIEVADLKITICGFMNKSVVNSMGEALSNILFFSLRSMYLAIYDEDSMVVVTAPIISELMTDFNFLLLQSLFNIGNNNSDVSLFPPSVLNLEEKIEFSTQMETFWEAENRKIFKLLTESEKQIKIKKSDNALNLFEDQIKTLITSSDEFQGEEILVMKPHFPPMLVDTKNTIGKWIFGERISAYYSKSSFGNLSYILWIMGITCTMLAMNNFIPPKYSMMILCCIPNLSNFVLLNINIVITICGSLLSSQKEYAWCYSLFFIITSFSVIYLMLGDSLPSKIRRRVLLIGSFCGAIISLSLLFCFSLNSMNMIDQRIQIFGDINASLASLFTSSTFPVSIFFIQIFYNAFNSPDKFTILKGKHVDELIEKEKRESRKGQKKFDFVNPLFKSIDFVNPLSSPQRSKQIELQKLIV